MALPCGRPIMRFSSARRLATCAWHCASSIEEPDLALRILRRRGSPLALPDDRGDLRRTLRSS